jgi:FkbM family methyltransferase
MNIKAIIYQTGMKALKLFWHLRGGRRISAFGHEIIVSPNTIFPSYRKLRLPRGGYDSEIVKYADYVQMHAICNYVSQLQNRPVIIDVGAHHGAYAIVIGHIVRPFGGRVIAVEPNPQAYKALQSNVQLNNLEDVVICEQAAVSDKPGSMHLLLDDSQSQITLRKSNVSVPVEAITMKLLLDKHGIRSVDLLIIDVEGAELPVLKGFPWEMVKVKKIFCELHPYAWADFKYKGEEMRQFLIARSFDCYDMYFQKHTAFDKDDYIGPTLFVPLDFYKQAGESLNEG